MLIVRPVSVTSLPYWQRGTRHSTWMGRGAGHLGLVGTIEVSSLRQALLGRGPDGSALTARPALRRRQGWDFVLAAPKSVSLLAATLSPDRAQLVRDAHRQAVRDTVELAEERAVWLRRDRAEVPGTMVAAGFEHWESNAGDPHLHTHVVVANLAWDGEARWGCLVPGPLWHWREALGAGFQLALRERLRQAGLCFDWRLSPGGLGEVAAVPSEVLGAASSRSRAVWARARSFGSASSSSTRVSQGATRSAAPSRLKAMWDAESSEKVAREAAARPALPGPPPVAGPVVEALAARASAFSEPDALVALAEANAFLGVQAAAAWARAWCQEADRVGPALAEQQLACLGYDGPVAAAARWLACGPEGVAVVPSAPWLAQAACIDAARAVWQAAGTTVEVTCPTDLEARRWRALTSLQLPGRSAPASSSRVGRRVLVVDSADNLSPRALAQLVDQARAEGSKLVLVVGGTQGAKGPYLSRALGQLEEELSPPGLHDLPLSRAGAGLGRGAGPLGPKHPAASVPGIVVRGASSGADAMAHALAAWRAEPASLMVAYGPPEAEALNMAAHQANLQGGGHLARVRPTGGTAVPGGRQRAYLGGREFVVGDRVLALRRIGPVKSATWGTVVALGPSKLTVEWAGPGRVGRSEVGAADAHSLGYGYATTVPYLRGWAGGRGAALGPGAGGGLVVLGDPLELGRLSREVHSAWVTLSARGSLVLAGGRGWQQAAVAELATGWPDEAMLRAAGPRPLSQAARARWEGIVARCARQRARSPGWDMDAASLARLADQGYLADRAPVTGRAGLGPGRGPVAR